MNIYIINIPTHARILKYSLVLVSASLLLCILRMDHGSLNYRSRKQSDNRYLLFGNSYPHGGNRDNQSSEQNTVHYSPKHVLCVSFKGRLGNLMFQYASAFGIAKQKNMTVRISEHDRIAQIFNTSAQKVPQKTYCKYAIKKFEKRHCAFDPNLINFTRIYVKLYDYLQSWKYFASVSSELRQEFKFNDTVRVEADMIFHLATRNAKFANQNSTYVGVHIRRGDMFYGQIKNESQISGYNIATITYIENAMGYFRKRYQRVTFVVCSDDIRWAIWQLGRFQKILNLVFIHKTPEVDLAILGMCNHTIMTTGTFGWWAGWLAGGTTVYYRHYVKEDSALRKQFSADFSDYFYPDWIPME